MMASFLSVSLDDFAFPSLLFHFPEDLKETIKRILPFTKNQIVIRRHQGNQGCFCWVFRLLQLGLACWLGKIGVEVQR